jgi:hypothetical protein
LYLDPFHLIADEKGYEQGADWQRDIACQIISEIEYG